jgi:hypothetical protein
VLRVVAQAMGSRNMSAHVTARLLQLDFLVSGTAAVTLFSF